MNMKLSSYGFLFHRNINRRENKAQIPLIREARAVKIPISNIREIIKDFSSKENVMNLPGRGRVSISS